MKKTRDFQDGGRKGVGDSPDKGMKDINSPPNRYGKTKKVVCDSDLSQCMGLSPFLESLPNTHEKTKNGGFESLLKNLINPQPHIEKSPYKRSVSVMNAPRVARMRMCREVTRIFKAGWGR